MPPPEQQEQSAKYAAAVEVAAAEYDIAVIGKKYSELLLQIANK